jgi:type VI secretion system secreted protein VgrG
MATYQQAERPMTVSSAELEPDDLLLVGFTGNEEISQLFSFELDLLAENQTDIAFDKVLGESVTISLALTDGKKRYFNGICKRLSQGPRDHTFTSYRMEVVPKLWLLSKNHRSRIFQQMTVPDILAEVLDGIDFESEIQGEFHPRDYCVQYRESDFAFAGRLMEEEGIYYFFKHEEESHTMVLGNTPQSHPDTPESSTITWEDTTGGVLPDFRIHAWEKSQELRAGKYTLWDNTFEMPDKHLEADQPIDDEVQAGKVKHKLKLGAVENLEIYEYPGEYAQRFDGVNPGGGDRAADLRKIFDDNKRTVGIRMQQEMVPALMIRGEGGCRNFTSGHKFKLERHFNADGEYLLTSVDHVGQLGGNYRSGENAEFTYENRFTCIPFAMSFRPMRQIPRPRIHGTQTAIVVGPRGEEIFTDKYGRIKVQFPWDRNGKYDDTSSCWIRVAYSIAGAQSAPYTDLHLIDNRNSGAR